MNPNEPVSSRSFAVGNPNVNESASNSFNFSALRVLDSAFVDKTQAIGPNLDSLSSVSFLSAQANIAKSAATSSVDLRRSTARLNSLPICLEPPVATVSQTSLAPISTVDECAVTVETPRKSKFVELLESHALAAHVGQVHADTTDNVLDVYSPVIKRELAKELMERVTSGEGFISRKRFYSEQLRKWNPANNPAGLSAIATTIHSFLSDVMKLDRTALESRIN